MKELANLDYFEYPCKKIKSKLLSFKFHLGTIKISTQLTEIFVCNKTSPYDKFFISNCLENNFVFLKDSVVKNLYENNYSEEELDDLKHSLTILSQAFVSVVIFPEKHQSVVGDFSNISKDIIDFIYDLEFDRVSFINLIGTYYIKPIWANADRICDTKIENKFSITPIELTRQEFHDKFRKYTPSSASVYSKRIPIYLRGNKFAEGFERFLYICPNCNKFFSVFSEFSCLKCKNCGTAFEFSNMGTIDLCKHFTNIDEAQSFQFDILSSMKPTYSVMFVYDTLKYKDFYENSKTILMDCERFSVFQDKITFAHLDDSITIPFDKIIDIFLDYGNKIYITWSEGEEVNKYVFVGENRENLYIILDILQYYKNNIEFFSK